MSVSDQINAGSGTIVGMDLVGCQPRDVARSIAFYRDVLGMTPTFLDEQGRGAEFTLADGTTFGLWKPDDGAEPVGVGVMFAVDDMQAALTRIRSRGATLTEPIETPVCFMAFGSDPDGNRFVIHQRKVRE